MNDTTIYLIRHGSTENNENKIFQGHLDVSSTRLTKKGIEQVNEYFEIFKNIKFDSIFCSDLGRSKETAERLAEKFGQTFTESKLLRGKCLGKFEGLPVSEYRRINKKSLEDFKTMSEEMQWNFKVEPGVESNAEVLERLLSFLNGVIAQFSGKTILIVTHGGTIRNLLFHLGWAKQHELKAGSVNNVSYVKITHNGQNFVLNEVFGVTKGLEIS
jgi:broad specificity phosphatase PhoE